MKAQTISGRPTPAQFRKWRDEAYADFAEPVGSNKRAAHCRVCGCELGKGEGVGYVEFMNDGYRASDHYVCHGCEDATRPGSEG